MISSTTGRIAWQLLVSYSVMHVNRKLILFFLSKHNFFENTSIYIVIDLCYDKINFCKIMTKKRSFYFIIIPVICLTAGYFFVLAAGRQFLGIQDISGTKNAGQSDQVRQSAQDVEFETAKDLDTSSQNTEGKKTITISKKIEQRVPFTSQAPFANWSDPNFQNACEEASIIMAMAWVNSEGSISPQEAQKRILEIIDFENKTFGYSTDTDTSDIARIFREYFKYENIQAREDITAEDIRTELQKGNLVIVPAFGQALGNPNFVQPGPVAHMLVIIGYDPASQQFITNDPGTRKGAGYRYNESLLFKAIWEYESGSTNPPIPAAGNMKKAMISVSK
jgi:hypothetical protein